MTSLGSLADENLPTHTQVSEVQTFIGELDGLKSKLESKKAEAQKVIRSKMKDLHQLIDKWETRFLDTMAETLDEKIEGIAKQQEKLRSTVDWIQEQRKTKRLSRVFPSALRTDSPQPAVNEADTEDGLASMVESVAEDEEETDKPEEELAKKHWRVWKTLKFPLQPSGVTTAEVNVDLWNEFGQLLEESRKSLKRSFLFVGGIVRAYMRRGHKKDEWVAMVRRLEARVETSPSSSSHASGGPGDLDSVLPFLSVGLGAGSSGHSSPSIGHHHTIGSQLSMNPSASSLVGSGASGAHGAAFSSPLFSTIWVAISDIYKYRNLSSVKAPLTKQLQYMYSNYPHYVEFYLPQLVSLMLNNKDFPLTDFLFECCRNEPHFAIQTYFLISSMSQVGSAKWQKRCIKILKLLIKAIPTAQLGGATFPNKSKMLPSSSQSNLGAGSSDTSPSDGKTQAILNEFPLGLPTDSHNLMLLFSPRSSGAIPITHGYGRSVDLMSSGGIESASGYSTSPEPSNSSMVSRSETSPIPFPSLTSVTEEVEEPVHSDSSLTSRSLPHNLPSFQPPTIKLTNSSTISTTLSYVSPRSDTVGPIDTSVTGATAGDVIPPNVSSLTPNTPSSALSSELAESSLHSNLGEIIPIGAPPDDPFARLLSISIPIPPPMVPPPAHLYSYSPVNSPSVEISHLPKHDITVEIKAALSAVAEVTLHTPPTIIGLSSAVTDDDSHDEHHGSPETKHPDHPIIINPAETSPVPASGHQKRKRGSEQKKLSIDSSSSATKSTTSTQSSSNETSTNKTTSVRSSGSSAVSTGSNTLSPPQDVSHTTEAYNSDDPEEELKRLTRITKPPTAPRVEKNLEVPIGKEYFFTQIKFMRKLIDVSRKLGELYGKPELYKPQLDKELEALSPYIDTGFAYMPHASGVRTRVLRFALSDCHPIPTYGRVLYKMIMEVVDLPAHYTKEMADEYVKLNKDFMRLSHQHQSGHSSIAAGLVASSSGPSVSARSASCSTPSYSEVKNASSHHDPAIALINDSIPSGARAMVSSVSLPSIVPPTTTLAFGDSWKDVRRRLKAHSQYSALPHWDVRAYIVKHGDLVLQEQFVMQLLVQFQHIWELEGLPLKLQCYNIMATSYQSGLIEVVPNSISLDKLKKVTETNGSSLSLFEFFKKHWPTSEDFKRARSNFISSLAAYSVVCYLLQIKDRHNGNIMLDADGCLFHIDFGYLLARTIKFEKAPFKLTDEFIEVLGGDQSKSFRTYCNLVVLGFLAVRKHYEKIQLLVEMSAGEGAAIPCLEGDTVAPNLRKRFHLDWNEVQCEEYILGLIGEARDNWRTQIYDTYQRIVNDIH